MIITILSITTGFFALLALIFKGEANHHFEEAQKLRQEKINLSIEHMNQLDKMKKDIGYTGRII